MIRLKPRTEPRMDTHPFFTYRDLRLGRSQNDTGVDQILQHTTFRWVAPRTEPRMKLHLNAASTFCFFFWWIGWDQISG